MSSIIFDEFEIKGGIGLRPRKMLVYRRENRLVNSILDYKLGAHNSISLHNLVIGLDIDVFIHKHNGKETVITKYETDRVKAAHEKEKKINDDYKAIKAQLKKEKEEKKQKEKEKQLKKARKIERKLFDSVGILYDNDFVKLSVPDPNKQNAKEIRLSAIEDKREVDVKHLIPPETPPISKIVNDIDPPIKPESKIDKRMFEFANIKNFWNMKLQKK
ncbi:hypothetical protein NBO_19g0008 [Nosema bombycis CQ1]|uniref:Uncharacterized protein n=1 Tax=Nosema bombycis (strain CQ1 / CVCC 102059) TaxID=578461 RepID=R0MK88_NOSB1|nr:hypothetical protein NBO_124g0003 [Nosema bombycis CQ1]EOB14655.1 hypothetical protein NBO_19g0008 [Nosema bombycis CQ1]|eukprot:EOB13194.1 hypothetical protein NBO_124g0003 [Nosema bombycis CQ1]